ncbi:MAG: GNAT family N-acetyltransferase [Hyphomicrobiaceae bacterium]
MTPGAEMTAEISVVRLTAVDSWSDRMQELDPIFFEASATRFFPDEAARQAFRERWLGRYLVHWPDMAHVAMDDGGAILGYIVGACEDPADDPLFDDIGYWPHIAHLTARYPGHLHINLAAEARNRGIGQALIAAFLSDLRRKGVSGVHLVTGRDSRNRSFYARCGFEEAASLEWGGTPIVMLARQL